jgi:tetratricopeptide (TPR) repeat protein
VLCGLLLGCGLAVPSPVLAQEPGDAQMQSLLLDGVRAFRAEQYDSALAIFRRVEQQSARPDIGMYLGMALHKLGRHAEALSAFRVARRGGLAESVADYYDAVSCYRLGMYERARVGFAALLAEPEQKGSPPLGPRLREGAERFLATIERSAPRQADPARPEQLPTRRLDAALKQVSELPPVRGLEGAEWLEEAALLLPLLPPTERTAYSLRFQELLTTLQQSLSGPTASQRSVELTAVSQRVRSVLPK